MAMLASSSSPFVHSAMHKLFKSVGCFGLSVDATLKYSTQCSLSSLRPAKGSNKKPQRVGRGIGSGGKKCGRGDNGQKSRPGNSIPRGFEGGQTPLFKRLPKRNHTHGLLVVKKREAPMRLHLDRLQMLIDTGRIDPGEVVDVRALHKAGFQDLGNGLSIEGKGAEALHSAVTIVANTICPKAIEAVESRGGLAVSVYHDRKGIRQLLFPASTRIHPSLPQPKLPPPPTHKLRIQYSNPLVRGYLHAETRDRLHARVPGYFQQYLIVGAISDVKESSTEKFDYKRIQREIFTI